MGTGCGGGGERGGKRGKGERWGLDDGWMGLGLVGGGFDRVEEDEGWRMEGGEGGTGMSGVDRCACWWVDG